MRRGQYFTLEQMLLFTIGIIMTTSIYFTLVNVNQGVENLAVEDQMYEIGDIVSSQINRAYNTPGEIKLTFEIPKKISGFGYELWVIEGVQDNLALITRNSTESGSISVVIPLNKEYNATGMLFSSSGKVVLRKEDKEIIIGRF